jgi:DNA-binding MarR family transcriptional regulator
MAGSSHIDIPHVKYLFRKVLRTMPRMDESREIPLLLATLVGQLRARHDSCAEESGLPAAQAAALVKLDGTPLPMHELAERLGCHTSNATGIADRLAARGLVAREDDPADRRVKKVGLTPAGLAARDSILRCAESHPSPLDRLTAEQRRDLLQLLRAATDAETMDPQEMVRWAARMMSVSG